MLSRRKVFKQEIDIVTQELTDFFKEGLQPPLQQQNASSLSTSFPPLDTPRQLKLEKDTSLINLDHKYFGPDIPFSSEQPPLSFSLATIKSSSSFSSSLMSSTTASLFSVSSLNDMCPMPGSLSRPGPEITIQLKEIWKGRLRCRSHVQTESRVTNSAIDQNDERLTIHKKRSRKKPCHDI